FPSALPWAIAVTGAPSDGKAGVPVTSLIVAGALAAVGPLADWAGGAAGAEDFADGAAPVPPPQAADSTTARATKPSFDGALGERQIPGRRMDHLQGANRRPRVAMPRYDERRARRQRCCPRIRPVVWRGRAASAGPAYAERASTSIDQSSCAQGMTSRSSASRP